MKVGFIAQDSLSALIFTTFFTQELATRDGVEAVVLSSLEPMYDADIAALPARHIAVPADRFINPSADWRYFWRVWQICRQERFDVVVTFGTKPNLVAAPAARLAGVRRMLVAVRGLGRVFDASATNPRARVLRAVVRRMYQLSSACASKVWFTNPHDRAFFLEHGLVSADRTFMTRNAVNLQTFSMDQVPVETRSAIRTELGLETDQLVVVMVARLVWQKGVREFVEAARQVRLTTPGVQFLLVAPHEQGPEAVPESFVVEAMRAGHIVWVPFRKDIRDVYAACDIAVLPSYYKEGGYPRALLEPMALGKPVIGADTDDCRGPVVNGENGFLVPPRDSGALATALQMLVDDSVRRDACGRRSLEIIREQFDDRVVGRQVLAEIGVPE